MREAFMMVKSKAKLAMLLTGGMLSWVSGPAAAGTLNGKVLGGGQPISNSTVTLWAASAGAPAELGQARTGADGSFTLNSTDPADKDATLYLTAMGGQPKANVQGGDNPAIALMTVIGSKPPATVTINEMTTVASVWTHAQFLDGSVIKGPALSLRIAAGNVPNFVNLETGGWGDAIQGPFNSTQTPTMANFATLSTLLAGCTTQVSPDACNKLFAVTTPPSGKVPTDTLTAAEAVARNAAFKAGKIIRAAGCVLPCPKGQDAACDPLHALPQLCPERLGAAAQVHRRRA
jgi:hypothetical protein